MSGRTSVPHNLFGEVPEPFYADLGRVAMLAALLDQRLHDLYVQLAGVNQMSAAGTAGTQLISQCRNHIERFALDQRSDVDAFFEESLRALLRRNAVLHSLWVFPGTNDYGWRHPCARALRGSVATQDPREVAQLVRDLVDLTERAMPVLSFIRPGRQTQP